MDERDQRATGAPRAALLRRSWLLLLVLGAVAVAGCIPIPPGGTASMISGRPRTSPTAWQAGAGCKWGSTTTAGDASKGTVKLQSELCWDANGGNLYIGGVKYSCNAGSGWTAARKQVIYDGLYKWTVSAVCQFAKGNSAYGVKDRHSWSTSGFYQLYRQGCSTGSDSSATQCDQADPPTWLTYGFEDEWLDARPAPQPLPRWIQGSVVPSTDPAVVNAAVTVDGKATTNLGGGKFRFDLPAGGTESHTVSIAAPPNYTVGWEICVNQSDDSCHNGKAVTSGNSVVVKVNPGDYWDLRWHLTAVGSVSGTSVIGNDLNSRTERDIASGSVYMDDVQFARGGDYSKQNVPVGLHKFSVLVPPGWSVGYTMCAPGRSDCHGNTPTPGSSVQVNVVKGQDVSLYWHFTPPPSPACNKPANIYGGVSQLRANECLHVDQGRISSDGKFMLILQSDGNLVIYATATMTPIWASGTTDYQDVGTEAVLQGDGNFVIYAAGKPVWDTETFDSAPVALVLQTNGDLQLVEAAAPYTMLWHSFG